MELIQKPMLSSSKGQYWAHPNMNIEPIQRPTLSSSKEKHLPHPKTNTELLQRPTLSSFKDKHWTIQRPTLIPSKGQHWAHAKMHIEPNHKPTLSSSKDQYWFSQQNMHKNFRPSAEMLFAQNVNLLTTRQLWHCNYSKTWIREIRDFSFSQTACLMALIVNKFILFET